MYVPTVPVELAPAEEAEKIELAEVLDRDYGVTVAPGRVSRFLEKTTSSAVYRCELTDGGYVVVKKSYWTESSAALEKAYGVSEVLRERGVALPRVFRNRRGSFINQAGSDRLVVLEYVEGRHFSSKDEEFAAAGRALGIFHRQGAEYLKENPGERANIISSIPVEKPYEESRAIYDALRADLLSPHDCGVPQVCEAVRRHIALIDETVRFVDGSGVSDPALPAGILHNDFHTNNSLFADDGSFAAFLDIDQVGVGPYIWDVGNTLASFASNFLTRHPGEDFEPKAKMFLQAHHREFPLPPEQYPLAVAATQRWDLMRILRILRRHHYENDRLPGLLPKIKDRLIPRIAAAPEIFSFLTGGWIQANLS